MIYHRNWFKPWLENRRRSRQFDADLSWAQKLPRMLLLRLLRI